MKRHRTLVIITIMTVAFAGSLFWAIKSGKLKIYTLMQKKGPGIIKLEGNVETRIVQANFRVSGRIAHMYVEEGDRVAKGQILAQLDQVYFKYAVKQAEAQLKAQKFLLLKLKNGTRPQEIERARDNTRSAWIAYKNVQKKFLRAKHLIAKGIISRQKFDDIKAAFEQAEARLKVAEATQKLLELGPRKEDIERARALVEGAKIRLLEAQQRLLDTNLYSPVNGIIQTKVHEAGDFVSTGMPVYIIAIQNPVWIRAYVNEIQLGKIYPGMKVYVETDTGNKFVGQIGFISPVAEFTPKMVQTEETRTSLVYRIRIVVKKSENKLRQGMPVSIYIKPESKSNAGSN